MLDYYATAVCLCQLTIEHIGFAVDTGVGFRLRNPCRLKVGIVDVLKPLGSQGVAVVHL